MWSNERLHHKTVLHLWTQNRGRLGDCTMVEHLNRWFLGLAREFSRFQLLVGVVAFGSGARLRK